ncbi:MAG: hypothetical protein ACMXX7_00450 [Candidatus Woesearchaeota archaeon]
MNKDLKKYVDDKLHSGISEDIIKHNLVNAGWEETEIEKALDEGYKSKRNRFLVGTISISAILIITLGLITTFFLYDGMIDSDPEIEQVDDESTTQEVSLSSCSEVDFEDKHTCYFEKVQESFNCSDLEDSIERNYCFRALEDYYLQ